MISAVVAQRTVNPLVTGSNPVSPDNFSDVIQIYAEDDYYNEISLYETEIAENRRKAETDAYR